MWDPFLHPLDLAWDLILLVDEKKYNVSGDVKQLAHWRLSLIVILEIIREPYEQAHYSVLVGEGLCGRKK